MASAIFARFGTIATIAMAAFAVSPSTRADAATASAFLTEGDTVDAPRGFVDMCRTDATFCSRTEAVADDSIVTGALRITAHRHLPDGLAYGAIAARQAGEAGGGQCGQASPWSATASVFDSGFLPEVAAPWHGFTPAAPPTGIAGQDAIAALIAPLYQAGMGMSDIAMSDMGRAGDARMECAARWDVGQDLAKPLLQSSSALLVASLPPRIAPAPVPMAQAGAPPARRKSAALRARERAELAMLNHVNRSVNDHVIQVADSLLYGREEYWQRSGVQPGAAGDCEDLAIEKRLQLIEQGYPADHLTFAVVYAQGVGLHTILVAQTARGDMVLDSRSGFIRPWSKIPYTWISVQSTRDPMLWHRVEKRA